MTDDIAKKSPGEFIREELEVRGWTQVELAKIMGRPIQAVNEILQAKKSVTTETAAALGAAFGNGADVWMKREIDYRLGQTQVDTSDISRRAKIFALAPITEIQKRGWIRHATDVNELEQDILNFLEISDLDQEPLALGPMRKSDASSSLSPSQRAWCFRVRQLAKIIPAAPYDEARLPQCEKAMRKLAAYPQEASKLAEVLASFGIRFVVVEPLSGSKVDGVALWLDENSPVIGVSVRYDRVDAFWFTVGHEMSHIKHRDTASFDCDLDDGNGIDLSVKPAVERRADAESAAALIDPNELQSFIRRVGPLYSKEQIVQFAHRIKIHPGIIVGQLQHRREISYRTNREMLSKVRDAVVSTALTDGWGHVVENGV